MFWVRQFRNNVTPLAQNDEDLLTGYLTTAGLTAQANDLVLERLHLLVSVDFTATTLGANTGVFVSAWVDSRNQTRLSAISNPYDQQFLIYDILTAYEAAMGGGATPFKLMRRYDVKARRKIPAITDSIWLQLGVSGTASMSTYAVLISMLLRHS